jgi:DNA-binding response OmpR family regulator
MAKILIIDDEPQITALLEKFLSWAGHTPTSVTQSSKAVETALLTEPDLIILDLMMPDPDGFKVCRLLRAFPSMKRTPILIVTALNDEDSRIVAFGAGATDYMTKPIILDELGDRIKSLLKK